MIAAARVQRSACRDRTSGDGVLGRDTPAAARFENMARFLDFVGESTRAAEQACDILLNEVRNDVGRYSGDRHRSVETAVSTTGVSGETP